MTESAPENNTVLHDTELGKLGYAQELFRSMGGFSNFAIGFSVVSVLTGAVTLYDYGLRMGGPLEMTLGWPIVAFFTMFVVLSMAELASSLPTSGSMYHWSCELGGKGWGWFTAWFIILGYTTALAGIDYGCAQFLMPMIGLPASQVNLLILYVVLLGSHALINQYGIKLVSWLNDFSVTVHIVGLVIIIGALLIFAPKQDISYLTTAMTRSSDKLPYWGLFILGLLQAQWTLAGYDSCASVSEETVDARTTAPWGMVIAVVVSTVVGYIMLLALTLSIKDIDKVLTATDEAGHSIPAVVAILVQSLGPLMGKIVSVLTAMAMWFCGLGAVTGCSRVIYAFARDEGLPFSNVFKRVEEKHHVPVAAIWGCVGIAGAAIFGAVGIDQAIAAINKTEVTGTAYAVVTSISTICLYLAYTLPVYLSWAGRHDTPIVQGPWHLGKYSHIINSLAILWTIFICSVISIANGGTAGKTMLTLILLLSIWYALREKNRFKGPHWMGKGLSD